MALNLLNVLDQLFGELPTGVHRKTLIVSVSLNDSSLDAPCQSV